MTARVEPPAEHRGVPHRIRHKGAQIRADGAVSALCFKRPRAIDMKVATWVYRDDAVDCPRCIERIRIANAETPRG